MLMKNIIVLVGLPGSGKTTFAMQNKNKNTKVYDIDAMITKKNTTLVSILKKVKKDLIQYDNFILDGLFLNENQHNEIAEFFNKTINVNIIFHYWEVDRKSSLWNDLYRRSENALNVILKAKIDKPDYKKLIQINQNVQSIIHHKIIRKSLYEVFKSKYNLEDVLKSESWTIYGKKRTYNTDWQEDDWLIEKELDNFNEFDELIEKLCPNITYLQYKKLYKKVTKTIEFDMHDYYSITKNKQYVCDIKELFTYLFENQIITEESLTNNPLL